MGLWFWRPLWRESAFTRSPVDPLFLFSSFVCLLLAVLGLVAMSRLPLFGASGGPL